MAARVGELLLLCVTASQKGHKAATENEAHPAQREGIRTPVHATKSEETEEEEENEEPITKRACRLRISSFEIDRRTAGS